MSKATDLEAVPGIGDVRAEALRRAGYATASDVATAAVGELREVSGVGNGMASCIRETSRNVCGDDDTLSASIARDLGAYPGDVAAAYAELAPAGITPREAEPTLRRLFGDAEAGSVLRFDDYSPKYRHFLFEAGFELIEDVATADLDSLTDVNYIGPSLASRLQTAAEERLATDDGDSDDDTPGAVRPWQLVRVPAPQFLEWSDAAHVVSARWYDPDVWEQDRLSNEIISFAKQGEMDLLDTFHREVSAVYEAAVGDSAIDPAFVTVMPGHDGTVATPLAELARGLAADYGLTYRELLDREQPGRRQKFLPGSDRWRNQDRSLEAPHDLSGRSAVVLDDISTSGASFTVATRRLHQQGADDVVCLALGLTRDQRQPVTTVEDPTTTLSDVADGYD